MSDLQDALYNVYRNMKMSKELQDALEKKYKTDDAIIAKFLNFKKVDSKVVVIQVQELQVIIHILLGEGRIFI